MPRVGESKPDWEIWIDMAHALGARDRKLGAAYWQNAFPVAWKDYRNLWATFLANTPGMGGMTQQRMEARAEPLLQTALETQRRISGEEHRTLVRPLGHLAKLYFHQNKLEQAAALEAEAKATRDAAASVVK